MADDKEPFDPEKTVVDVRRPERKPAAPEEADKTIVSPVSRPAPPPASPDSDRTVAMKRAPEVPPPPAEDRTVVRPTTAGPSEGEQTIVRPGSFPAPGVAPGFEIVCLSGQARGRRFPVPPDETLVGSNRSCQVVLPGVEGVHAKIQKIGEELEIQNLGAKGSLFVGSRRPARAKLKSGDLLRIGDVVVRFVQSGDVFSSDYSDAEFSAGGLARFVDPAFLKENPLYLAIGGLGLLLVLLILWPSPSQGPSRQGPAGVSATEEARRRQVESLLASGEVLFNSGKILPPADRPDAENAFRDFNQVLELDPGNEQALAWLKRIDAERELRRQARDREEELQAAAERQRREELRRQTAERVAALLTEGDLLFDKGQVVEPVGRNALVLYREALELDPQSLEARERVSRAVGFYVDRGDQFRDRNRPWQALESYRKAARASGDGDPEIAARIKDMETRLRAGMAGSATYLVMYKDDRGRLVVLDEMDKVPSQYRDRAVEVTPADAPKPPGGGIRR